MCVSTEIFSINFFFKSMEIVYSYSLLGAMFPLPRIIYAMASDGLIFEWMGKVSSRFHTPLMGTFSAGILTGSYFFFFFYLDNIHCCLLKF